MFFFRFSSSLAVSCHAMGANTRPHCDSPRQLESQAMMVPEMCAKPGPTSCSSFQFQSLGWVWKDDNPFYNCGSDVYKARLLLWF